ncbi:hypothetical protein C7C46_01620 [Streptomyces tateyamensis]|uniref:Uncharacterized protein n=1 Tax=Streptomyces tateyamensis TaxID=565073 RepID=A0A2V4NP01_9ACTN|nr:hypothetical protein [Streptomyces tateyamensis]PYC88077.1 hypothetical protein C7C46_01620 [Streptomyces tateyamensis]
MDSIRAARIAAVIDMARPAWEAHRDHRALQEFLQGTGCNGIDAVLVTKGLLGCSLVDAQVAFLTAPCRAAELAFHEEAMDALLGTTGEVVPPFNG